MSAAHAALDSKTFAPRLGFILVLCSAISIHLYCLLLQAETLHGGDGRVLSTDLAGEPRVYVRTHTPVFKPLMTNVMYF